VVAVGVLVSLGAMLGVNLPQTPAKNSVAQAPQTGKPLPMAARQKWEYLFIDSISFPSILNSSPSISCCLSNEKMNELGGEGWELAAVTTGSGSSCSSFAYFKRPIK
jgi:hypothetical protein